MPERGVGLCPSGGQFCSRNVLFAGKHDSVGNRLTTVLLSFRSQRHQKETLPRSTSRSSLQLSSLVRFQPSHPFSRSPGTNRMKKFPLQLSLVAALFVTSGFSAFAQDGSGAVSYRVDNFDLKSGVRIEQPPAPAPATKRRGRRLVTATNLNYVPSSAPLTQTTSMNVSSAPIAGASAPILSAQTSGKLSGFTTGNAAVDSYIVDSGGRNWSRSTFALRDHASGVDVQTASDVIQRRARLDAVDARHRVAFRRQQHLGSETEHRRRHALHAFPAGLFDGDVNLALAGYNAGEGAVMKYGYRVPPYSETQEYVRRISRRYDLIRDPLAVRNANISDARTGRRQSTQTVGAPYDLRTQCFDREASGWKFSVDNTVEADSKQ